MLKSKISFVKAGFLSAIFLLLLTSGYCERYERKMERRNSMRRYIDSARTVEQLRKDSLRRYKQAVKQQQDSSAQKNVVK